MSTIETTDIGVGRRRWSSSLLQLILATLLVAVGAITWAAPSSGQEGHEGPDEAATEAPEPTPAADAPTSDATADDEAAETLRLGADVYTATCSSCHQPRGVGIEGQFPPLLDNPTIQDTDYLLEVIRKGREGELEVFGTTYDGRMPAFSTLPDDEVDALVTYIQAGFVAPAAPVDEIAAPVADGSLPDLTNMVYAVALLVAVAVGFLVLSPRIVGRSDRLQMPWLDAWLKSAVIVVGFIVFTVFVPNWVLRNDNVTSLSRLAQDVIASTVWVAGLGAGLWALWYAHRDRRI